MATRYKAWVCGRSPAEVVGSNLATGHGLSLASFVSYQVEVSASGFSGRTPLYEVSLDGISTVLLSYCHHSGVFHTTLSTVIGRLV